MIFISSDQVLFQMGKKICQFAAILQINKQQYEHFGGAIYAACCENIVIKTMFLYIYPVYIIYICIYITTLNKKDISFSKETELMSYQHFWINHNSQ